MKNKITLALAVASSSLLASSTAVAEDNNADILGWDVKAAILIYSEPNRVSAIEPVISLEKKITEEESINLKLTFDSLTGASATGAVPTGEAQTFTRPSGGSTYTIYANETPLDDTFKDTRVALNAAWTKPLSRLVTATLGGNFSNEFDYTSFGLNTSLSRFFNQKNTTLNTGISYTADSINPLGGTPKPFSIKPASGSHEQRSDSETKTTLDLLAGVTQIIDKNSLFQLNYSFSQVNGYQNDPYKILSLIDANTGKIINGSLTAVYENRPDSRVKHSLYGSYKRNFTGNILDASYRFAIDDWGITSHTLDTHYKFALNGTAYLKPHFRFYQQSQADFYKGFIINGEQPASNDGNSYASADYRLSTMNTYTLGLEYGRSYKKQAWNVALEYYLQSPQEPDNKFADLNTKTLNPSVDALMLRFNYDF